MAAKAKRKPKAEPAKRGRGRPTKLNATVIAQAKKLCELGATDGEISDILQIDPATFYRWRAKSTEFCDSIIAGKEAADARVERSLYHRALGYEHPAVKVFMPAGAEKPVYAPITERYPPDTGAAIFWLKNRQKERWKDKQDHEHSGPDGGPIKTEDVSGIDVARRLAHVLERARREIQDRSHLNGHGTDGAPEVDSEPRTSD
jgi:hypothetical protein